MGGINGFSEDILSSIKSAELRSFLGDKQLGVSEKFVGCLENGELKDFLIEVSEIEKQGEITRDKVNKLIFDYFSKEKIEGFNDTTKQIYFRVNSAYLLLDKVFKDIFDNYKPKNYKVLNNFLNEISEISYLLLSNPIYTNPYFKDTYGLEQIDKIEIILHKLTRIIYDLYQIQESFGGVFSEKISKTADKLWEVLEIIEQFIH